MRMYSKETSGALVLKLCHTSEPPGILANTQITRMYPQRFDVVDMVNNPRICILDKFLGDIIASGLGNTL